MDMDKAERDIRRKEGIIQHDTAGATQARLIKATQKTALPPVRA